jgi:predicted RNA-binding Zn-ribbon protein involved in translation (DUF1610 family)
MSDIEPLSQIEPVPSRMCPSCGNTSLVKRLYHNGESNACRCIKCGWRMFL